MRQACAGKGIRRARITALALVFGVPAAHLAWPAPAGLKNVSASLS